MIKRILVLGLMAGLVGGTSATAEPVILSETHLDSVTAGTFFNRQVQFGFDIGFRLPSDLASRRSTIGNNEGSFWMRGMRGMAGMGGAGGLPEMGDGGGMSDMGGMSEMGGAGGMGGMGMGDMPNMGGMGGVGGVGGTGMGDMPNMGGMGGTGGVGG